jgi:hypothetical protein
MARPTKRSRALKCNDDNPPRRSRRIAGQLNATISHLGDVLPKITEFFQVEELMCLRCVCKDWTEEIKKTNVPLSEFVVNSLEKYNAMNVMTNALPNLQQIAIDGLGYGIHKWSDGEDPNEEYAAQIADWTPHDIEIISNFGKLRILEIRTYAFLNGRYPFLFNSFPLLQKLSLQECDHLTWDLEMLAEFPLLKELNCDSNDSLSGNISSLRVLKDTLEKVSLYRCESVEGNFMDLADFPHLKELSLYGTAVTGNIGDISANDFTTLKELYLLRTAVTGDIRDIGENDLSSLEKLSLPKGVYGGHGYELQRISDGPDFMRTLYLFEKQRPNLIEPFQHLRWKVSADSPDYYEDSNRFPFGITFVKAGCRFGYRWEASYHGINFCEVNWLDPEPDSGSSDYDEYIEGLQSIKRRKGGNLFQGFFQPPTEEEYNRIVDEYYDEEERRRNEEEEFYMRGLP